MRHATKILTLVVVAAMAAPALGDWDPSQPAKWVQWPDLSPMGMNVNASWKPGVETPGGQWPFVKVLADDFPCTSPGFITGIDIWGSWLNDYPSPSAPFKLSIHADVPAGVDARYSHPGQELWQKVFSPGEYTMRPWAEAYEYFYEPNTNQIIGNDSLVWQFNFKIPETEAFYQRGDPGKRVIYWLDVQALVQDPMTTFGWKTAERQWGDDACFADTEVFAGPPIGPAPAPVFWKDMYSPFTGQSIDLAFVIVPEPATMSLLAAGGLLALLRRRTRT